LRRAIVVVLSASAVLAAFAFWATREPAGERPDLDAAIEAEAARIGNGGVLDLTRVTDFAWEEVAIFPSYTGVSSIQDELDLNWSPLSPFGTWIVGDLFLGYDWLQLLVFTKDERVVAWAILNALDASDSTLVWFEDPELNDTYARDAARFRISDTYPNAYPLDEVSVWWMTPASRDP
jgi:hypothetical protein